MNKDPTRNVTLCFYVQIAQHGDDIGYVTLDNLAAAPHSIDDIGAGRGTATG